MGRTARKKWAEYRRRVRTSHNTAKILNSTIGNLRKENEKLLQQAGDMEKLANEMMLERDSLARKIDELTGNVTREESDGTQM